MQSNTPLWYTISAEHDEEGIDTGRFYVANGPDLEGGEWHTLPGVYLSVQDAMGDYPLVLWQKPDADADRAVQRVGKQGKPL